MVKINFLDDEAYFSLTHYNLPRNDRYYSSNRNVTPETAKHDQQEKYPNKLLVWLAVSPAGLSKPFYRYGHHPEGSTRRPLKTTSYPAYVQTIQTGVMCFGLV